MVRWSEHLKPIARTLSCQAAHAVLASVKLVRFCKATSRERKRLREGRKKWDFLICFGDGLTTHQRIGRGRLYLLRRNLRASSCAITTGKSSPPSISKTSLPPDW